MQESSCTVMGLSWGVFTPSLLALPPVDIVLGADSFYHEADFESLLATVSFLLSKKPPGQCVFYTVVQDRGTATIAPLLERWGMEARELEMEGADEEEEEWEEEQESLHLIAIVLKQGEPPSER